VAMFNVTEQHQLEFIKVDNQAFEERPTDLLCHVAWSPNGSHVVCRMLRGLSVWKPDGTLIATYDNERPVESVTWFPHRQANDVATFLSVEGAVLRKFEWDGLLEKWVNHPQTDIPFKDITINDVAVLPESQHMICVGTHTHTSTLKTYDSQRKEGIIMLYNLVKNKSESEVFVVGESRNVKISKDGEMILISYEDEAPPQIWKIRNLKQCGIHDQIHETAHLELVQTLMPKQPVNFAGPSHFGGKNDELVICAGKDGTIYVWDTRSGLLLHEFEKERERPGESPVDELTSFAWNHNSEQSMFCTGHLSGKVRVWTSMITERAQEVVKDYVNIYHDTLN